MPRTKTYEDMNIVELRRLGGKRGVPHAWDLRKADLVDALERLGRRGRAAKKSPARRTAAARTTAKRTTAKRTTAKKAPTRRRQRTRRPR